jgi:branched-chain amino acid transport system permease protein
MTSKNQLSTFTVTNKKDLRKWRQPAVYAGLVIILAILPQIVSSQYTLHILILVFIYLIVASSFRTITISGQFPLAHGAFMGIGAYVAAMLSKWLNWPPWFTLPTAAVAAMTIGILIGFPFSRLRTIYYAMGSLFFGLGIIYIIYVGGTITGGYAGLPGIHPIFTGSRVPYYYLFLGLSLLSLLALYRFENCRIGTDLKAISQSYLVASSVGINEAFYRILALAVGCFFAGLAGACYAHYNRVITPNSFNLASTLWMTMYVLVGGIDNFAGPIIGTFILVIIPEYFRDLKMYSPYISAGILLVVVYLMPQGLVSIPQMVKSLYVKIQKRRKDSRAAGN